MGVDTMLIQNSTPILTFPLHGGRDWDLRDRLRYLSRRHLFKFEEISK